jgi:MATE family multidrug resistance protein
MALWVMGGCGLLFLVCGDLIASVFTLDREVALLTAQLLVLAAVFQVFDAVATVHLCALRNVGDTRFTFLATMVAGWGVMLPLTLVLGLYLGLGAVGAWTAMTFELAVLALVTGRRVSGIRRGRVGRLDLLLGR